MKKLGKACLMFLSFAIMFSACEDDIVQSELTLDDEKTGSVEVYFYADIPGEELSGKVPPPGTNVHVSVDNSELTTIAAVQGRWSTIAQIDDEGKIVVDNVPTTDNGVEVKVMAESFIHDGIFYSPTAGEITVDLLPNQKVNEAMEYEVQAAGSMVETGTLEASFNAKLDKTEPGNQPVPDKGIRVFLNVSLPNLEWSSIAEIQDGKITVENIPTQSGGVDVDVNAEDFIYNQQQQDSHPMDEMEMLYKLGSKYPEVRPDQTTTETYTYDYEEYGDEVITVERTFHATFIDGQEIEDESWASPQPRDPRNVNQTIAVRHTGGEWEMEVNPSQGRFTIELPIDAAENPVEFLFYEDFAYIVDEEWDADDEEWDYDYEYIFHRYRLTDDFTNADTEPDGAPATSLEFGTGQEYN